MANLNNDNNNHRPYHLYIGHTYFISGRCYEQIDYFKIDKRKKLFQTILGESIKRFNIHLYAWSILHNHYHLLFSTYPTGSNEMSQTNLVRNGKYTITELIRKLHKDTARAINQQDGIQSRKIWYQYWDYCIRNKPDFWKHFNYIIQQPLKHGLVTTLLQAYNYPHSSNKTWLARFGAAGLSESFEKYPVKNWTPNIID